MNWVVFALLSAFLTAVTGTLSKAGLEKVDSNVGLAVQSLVVPVIAWSVVLFQKHLPQVGQLDRKSLFFLLGAGLATGIAYLFYFAGLKGGDSSRVQPIDRLSLVFAIILAAIFLKEKMGWQMVVGGVLMAGGAVLVATVKQ